MADIADIVAVDRTVEILHPSSKEPIGLRVTLMHPDDDRLVRIKRSITDTKLHNDSRGKAWKSEQVEVNRDRVLFGAMTGWEWYAPDPKKPEDIATFEGEVPEFNQKNVFAAFKKLPWFRNQVDAEFSETEAFFANSKTA